MNVKKYLLAFTAIMLSMAAFAQTAPQPSQDQQAQMAQLLEQYQAEQAKLNKQFEEVLLAPVRTLVDSVLIIQQSGQEEITPVQEKELDALSNKLEAALNQLVAPVVKDLDIAQLNTQYQDYMKQMGVENPVQLTKETVTEMLKGMYLIGALTYFEQTQKLNQQELEVAMALFLPQPEEEQPAQ